jgi:hypothetical protein
MILRLFVPSPNRKNHPVGLLYCYHCVASHITASLRVHQNAVERLNWSKNLCSRVYLARRAIFFPTTEPSQLRMHQVCTIFLFKNSDDCLRSALELAHRCGQSQTIQHTQLQRKKQDPRRQVSRPDQTTSCRADTCLFYHRFLAVVYP